MIISVGYRVKSKRGIIFRRWANKVLKDYLGQNSTEKKSIFNNIYSYTLDKLIKIYQSKLIKLKINFTLLYIIQ